jgi:hypothetical protein
MRLECQSLVCPRWPRAVLGVEPAIVAYDTRTPAAVLVLTVGFSPSSRFTTCRLQLAIDKSLQSFSCKEGQHIGPANL